MSHSKSSRKTITAYQKELDELEQTKLKTGNTTQESVNSTRRMLQLVNECQDAGINTLRMLHHQGESLNRAEGGLDEVDHHLKEGDTTLTDIERMEKVPCFLLPCYLCYRSSKKKRQAKKNAKKDLEKKASFTKTPTVNELNYNESMSEIGMEGGDSNRNFISTSTSYSNSKSGTTTGQSSKIGTSLGHKSKKQQDRYFQRITGATEEDEIEENLDDVSSHLSSLKSQAIVMGSTVVEQNSQIDRMNLKAQVHQSKINNLKNRTTRLLNSDYSGDSDPSSMVSIAPKTVAASALQSGVCPCPCPCSLF